MKMPTLRTTAGNQSCCSDCRRAFSECSRWLAESGLTRVLIYRLAEVFHSAATSRTFLRTPNPLFTRFTRRPCLCVSKNQSGSLFRFPKAAPLVVERGFQGGEGRLSNQVQHLNRSSGVSQPRHLRGLLLIMSVTISTCSCVTVRKSNPFGKNQRTRPLMFSLLPRCQGE